MSDKKRDLPQLPLNLPDKEIADAVRKAAGVLLLNDGGIPGGGYSASMVLCSLAASANAESLTIELNGVTYCNEYIGDWVVKAQRVKNTGGNSAPGY